MGFAKSLGKRGFSVGYRNEMNMVGHKAPGKNVHLKSLGLFFYKLQILIPIVVAVKDVHRANATLGDMMRIIYGNNS